ncbi:hypothetical protein P7L64_02575 (plasmid) [Tistrella bauzanensis]|nr:hypothetical protein [Tistrella bauzanensis]
MAGQDAAGGAVGAQHQPMKILRPVEQRHQQHARHDQGQRIEGTGIGLHGP